MVQLPVDVTEAEQALCIIGKGAVVNSEDWQRLFATIPTSI
jgi:hypothetical protein